MKKILIVEDEQAIIDIVEFNLIKEGYTVLCAMDGEEGLEMALKNQPDLILLDVMLPKMDGFQICKKVRETKSVPIIMLTAREEEADKVLGLEIGADDYITKPFSMKELMARVKANIRRSIIADGGAENKDIFTARNLVFDNKNMMIFKNNIPLDITIREFELLRFLAGKPGVVFPREALLKDVWGYEYYGDVRTVDVTVRRLREKLEDDPANPTFILTKRGVGYYFG